MLLNEASNGNIGKTNNNNLSMSNNHPSTTAPTNPLFGNRPSLMEQTVPTSPLLTYSFLNSPTHAGSPLLGDTKDIPQLSLSMMNMSLNSSDSLISTSTSPSKLPFGNGTHQQSLSLDSDHIRQRDFTFDGSFSRQRGNSNGFPPIGGHLPKLSPRLDVNTTNTVYNQSISNNASRYNPQSPALASSNPFIDSNHGFVGSPLLGPNTTSNNNSARQQNIKPAFAGYPNQNIIMNSQKTLFGSAGDHVSSMDQPTSFGGVGAGGMIPISPGISPNNSPRHFEFSSGKVPHQTRALLQGGRSNSMPPIPAFSSAYSKTDGDLDRNFMKLLEDDESDAFDVGHSGWYPQNNGSYNGFAEEQYVVGQLEMSPSQGSPLISHSYHGYLDGNADYSGYKIMPPTNYGHKYSNSFGSFSGPNTSNVQISTNFNQANYANQTDIVSPTGDSTDSSEGEGKGHKHPGEYPSRTLFVRNISSNVDDQELRQLFESFGPIRQMYTSCKHRGFVMITYFDIRHAKQAKKNLQSKLIKKRKIDIHYSIPKENPPEKEQLNQETLVVFNLDPSITNEELKTIFTQFGGDVKEIRETPNKKFHKFIEFYDTRDAERAMKQLNKTELKGKKIKIEYSRPGGLRNRSSDSGSNESPTTVGTPDAIEITTSTSLPTTPNMDVHLSSPPKNDALLHPGIKSRRPRAISAEEKEQFKLDLEKVRCGIDKRTTLMVKNIPNKYTQKMLLETVDAEFKTAYDFFYLPIDFKNKCNVGYAFINFIDPKQIIPFVERFNNKKWEKFNSEKVCDITYARIQGKTALINHFQNSSLMCEEEDCRPIFY
ncbi:hypothetical protein FDP41_002013 [Naegleria fowleri]|uniref:RRM domain-containing protein n=1 Tax=Naegleria fowleri TaxID=5763 RepID=A0A6A5BLP9_NAEFO|nr:uncharacterized protein FDP41_002013 [Naegleria fowleri]KAF0978943.1 hypothetical protein FDP41_002013 [Naegleria fowleri]